jgi:hypothetical protein
MMTRLEYQPDSEHIRSQHLINIKQYILVESSYQFRHIKLRDWFRKEAQI